ncbi:MAG: hypothetical protein BGO98_49825 [Myxococcales bacterium 68-20]|nr:hypothetical protein [Myxococcales bacterium]OJY29913.1 MAG: hypothetical protein BGO98_49825 [Myxococcales bacterium 68-20]
MSSTQSNSALGVAVAFAIVTASERASAVDLPPVRDEPVKLDVTNVSIFTQRFDPRTTEGQRAASAGFGFWINRLNAQLSLGHFTLGTRLDSSIYWRRPEDLANNPADKRDLLAFDSYRFPTTIYPAKLWLTYSAPGIEVTVGDAYAQMARGFVMSMRKVDDLGIDTTVRGGKVAITKGLFSFTGVAGLANPSRVDEASGGALFLQRVSTDNRSPHPVFGSDRVVAAEIQAGRGLPIVLATSAARYTRCAPYAFDRGRIADRGLLSELGSCDPADTQTWIDVLDTTDPTRRATEVDMAAQSVEVPRLGPLGSLYVVGVTQRRAFDDPARNGAMSQGNALYATHSGTFGPIVTTLELKSYRNFHPVAAAVNTRTADAFANLAYSQAPTAEAITQDNMAGAFNACVNGGRARVDVRLSKNLVPYVQAIHARTQTENSAGACDRAGNFVGDRTKKPAAAQNDVWDGTTGLQLYWDESRSYLFSTVGFRSDVTGEGSSFYQEKSVTYTLSQYVGRATSIELMGRHRLREPGGGAEGWREGEHYTALKIAPKWVFSQGFEYTTRPGNPTYYLNGGLLFRMSSESNVKVLVGQQRGGLKCVNGVCRIFPAFEGARIELTLRF